MGTVRHAQCSSFVVAVHEASKVTLGYYKAFSVGKKTRSAVPTRVLPLGYARSVPPSVSRHPLTFQNSGRHPLTSSAFSAAVVRVHAGSHLRFLTSHISHFRFHSPALEQALGHHSGSLLAASGRKEISAPPHVVLVHISPEGRGVADLCGLVFAQLLD